MNGGYYRRFFQEEKRLGSGGYGAVYLVRHQIRGVDLGHYAMKKVPCGEDEEWLVRVLREVTVLQGIARTPRYRCAIYIYLHIIIVLLSTPDTDPPPPPPRSTDQAPAPRQLQARVAGARSDRRLRAASAVSVHTDGVRQQRQSLRLRAARTAQTECQRTARATQEGRSVGCRATQPRARVEL